MKCLLVLASLILTASLVGQVEHAPTVAQCQADQRLWLSKLLVDEKVKRDDRMIGCVAVDLNNQADYVHTENRRIDGTIILL